MSQSGTSQQSTPTAARWAQEHEGVTRAEERGDQAGTSTRAAATGIDDQREGDSASERREEEGQRESGSRAEKEGGGARRERKGGGRGGDWDDDMLSEVGLPHLDAFVPLLEAGLAQTGA